MAKKKIFISYDYDNDKHYKNLLVAWDENSEFDFGFSDQSADVSIQSTDAAAIKRAISAKIDAATYFLCLVGSKTNKSSWVTWEIEKAKDLKKKLVAVKISFGNTTPSGLLNAGASWAMSFTFDAIKKAIEDA
ncbi:MAG: TIR domain-containing protein [Deltaproteobacteria bacterium]|nr:TIR domain-containing protein [Deltaproteobacteria bacterium]